MANVFKTTLLMGLLTGFLLLVGRAIGGPVGMVVALSFAVLTNLGAWWFSDRIVLAIYRARPVGPTEAPELYRMVADLAQRAGIPMPKLYTLPQPAPNAFATGRDPAHAAVAVTEGLLRLLPPDEVRAVIAHELGHVAHRDTLISAIAASMAGAISTLASIAQWGLLLGGRDDEDHNPISSLLMVFLAPIAAMVVQMAVSRSREFHADAFSAHLIGDGEPLARALRRLEEGARYIPAQASPATAHLFIVNPLTGRRMMSMFSTHPSTEERVRALMKLDLGHRRFAV